MNKNFKKFELVFWLCLIIVVMVGIKIFYKPTPVATQLGGQATPTPTINQYPLQEKLPYQGNKFTIDKYVEAKVLQVTTKRTDSVKIKEEISKWLTDNGVSSEGMQIDWK
jgi:hypothetical protein